jgi:hypothetical protein
MSQPDFALALAKHANAEYSWLQMYSDAAGNVNLYVNDWPSSPDDAVLFTPYGGGAPTETMGNPFVFRNPRLQVMIRDPESEDAFDRARELFKFLGQIKETVIGGINFSRVKPVGEPSDIGPDENQRQRVTVNFEVQYKDGLP